jgi:hypothetical protein
MRSTMAVLLTLGFLVGGCGTTVTFTRIGYAAGAPKSSPLDVDIYLSDPPQRRHRDVGLLEAEQESDMSLDDTREMLRKLREAAAEHGCDAMFVKGVGSNTGATLGLSDHPSSTKTITATCISYTD